MSESDEARTPETLETLVAKYRKAGGGSLWELEAHIAAWKAERADCAAEHPPEPWASDLQAKVASLLAENEVLRAELDVANARWPIPDAALAAGAGAGSPAPAKGKE